ncbi:ricin-type beta-trefoil lectin domain protein [Streptomyces sp. NPDC060184]|uniref:ricin-type beta-trefoil lectin domain protein n=1 Tax=Streptomyces sp. NPDC060184 TaxID=3347064 RepID=UPI00365372B8
MQGPRRRRDGRRATTVAIAVALGLTLASPYAWASAPSPQAAQGEVAAAATPVYQDTSYSFEERAADLVARMTLEQKVRQLITNDAPAIPGLGVQGYTYWSEALHGIQSLGNSKNAGSDTSWPVKATGFPTSLATSMAWDPALQYEEGSAVSDEARGFLDPSLFGVGRNNLGSSADNYGSLTYFAPTVNNDRDPLWGRHDESYGEDPYLQAQLGVQFVNGFQGQNTDGSSVNGYLKAAATAKHYALNNVEDSRTAISSDVNDSQLRDYYTKQFAALIGQAHVAGLMTSYNAINGTPAVANTYTNNRLAKRTYGFAGLTTSDCGGVGTTYKLPNDGHDWAPAPWSTNGSKTDPQWIDDGTGDTVDARAAGQAFALRSGNDLNCSGDEMTTANVMEAVRAGLLSEDVLDTALVRVFTVRMRTGEFDPAGSVPYTSIDKSVIQSAAHVDLATRAADASMVLLKNSALAATGKPLLPLKASAVNKVVVLGGLADTVSLGSYGNAPDKQISMRQGITDALRAANPSATVTYDAAGTSTTSTAAVTLTSATQAAIKAADAVVVVAGTDQNTASEGKDRSGLALPGNYGSLIDQVAAVGNPNVVLDLQTVGAVDISARQSKAASIVYSAYNGQSQGTALADVLFGKQNPQGHLTFTWYKDDSQLAGKNSYGLTPAETDGKGQTYQYFTGTPSYPFGYGLSYTTFSYSAAQTDKSGVTADGTVNVSFDVTNTGNVPGATVAQLYAANSFSVSGTTLPKQRLVGFKNTGVLAPGEKLHITLPVKAADLSVWNPTTSRQTVFPGTWALKVASDSATVQSTATVTVSGTLTPKVSTVTVQPGRLVYRAGETLDLTEKNPWIKDDTDPAKEQRDTSLTADGIVEAVNNDQSFVDLQNTTVTYSSSDPAVATVDSSGIVTAGADGVATIKVTVGGVSGSMVMVVKGSLAVHTPQFVQAGQSATVTTTLTNGTGSALGGVTVAMPAPAGWTVKATTATSFASVAAGASATTTWLATPPSGVSPGTYPLNATATYDGGSHTADGTLLVPFASQKAAYTNIGVTDDADPAPGKYDGGGFSFSAQALAAQGLAPGTSFTADGLTYQWPDAAAGTPDAIDTKGQAVLISGTGSELGFVGSGTSGPHQGIGTIVYTDGSTQSYGLSFSDWWDNTSVAQGGGRLGTYDHINSHDGRVDQKVSLFTTKVQLAAGKTVRAVILPTSEDGAGGSPQGHVFAMAIGGTPHTPAPKPEGPTGHVTGQGDKCVDLAAGPAAGVQAVLASCDDDASQQWTLGTDKTLWNQGKCLATAEGGTTNGTDVVLDYCDGSQGQRWGVDAVNGYLVNAASGLCLENGNGSTADGNPLIIWACNSGDAGQKWKVPSAAVSGPTGRIAGYNGKCAEVTGGTTTDGTSIQLNTCSTGSGQSWTAATDGTLRALGKCLTAAAGGTADGTAVQLSTCTGTTGQKWTTDTKGQLVGSQSGKCLDATGPSSANGTKLQLWACAASDNQLWNVPSSRPTGVISGYGGKCAEVTGSLSANGTAIQLNTCSTGSGQSWTAATDGTLRALGKCLTAAAGGTADGTAVQLSTCTGTTGQKWTTDTKGQLVGSQSGKCLDATGPSSANGTKLQLWTCAATDNQLWKLPT